MIADFFTKPLQGALFYKFRNMVLGIDAAQFDNYKMMFEKHKQAYIIQMKKYDLTDSDVTSNKLKECVGNRPNGATKDRRQSGSKQAVG